MHVHHEKEKLQNAVLNDRPFRTVCHKYQMYDVLEFSTIPYITLIVECVCLIQIPAF